jgi:hypothetical protein
MFRKMLYKNQNQHRHGIYYRKLVEVKRIFQTLDPDHTNKVLSSVNSVVASYRIKSLGDKDASDANTPPIPSTEEVARVLSELSFVATTAHQAVQAIIRASRPLAGLIGQSYFMPLAIVMTAMLGKLLEVSAMFLYVSYRFYVSSVECSGHRVSQATQPLLNGAAQLHQVYQCMVMHQVHATN